MSNTDLHERLALIIGGARYNQFLRSLGGAVRKGRLFFWQEQLIDEARRAGLDLPGTLPELLASFSTARPIILPLAREEFLADPMKYWSHEDYDIPAEWLDEAASQPPVRENLSYALARSASKVGDFGLATDAVDILARTSSASQAVELYLYIRDTSQRLEQEWRPGFEAAFPSAVPHLPPVQGRRRRPKNQ